jgi:hypothetical protein
MGGQALSTKWWDQGQGIEVSDFGFQIGWIFGLVFFSPRNTQPATRNALRLNGILNNGFLIRHLTGDDGFAEKRLPFTSVHIVQHHIEHKG